MTFFESVRTCLRKYARFSGRASRAEYWWWVLFCAVGQWLVGTVNYTLGGVFALVTLLPYLAVATRRLHDTNRSGWWQLLGFIPQGLVWSVNGVQSSRFVMLDLIPLIGWLVLICWWVQDSREPNRFNG